MRTTSTLVGLVLFALTATARAEEAAPAAAATAPPAGGAAAAPAPPAGGAAAAPASTPTPAAAPSAPLADNAAAALTPVAGPPAVARRKIQVGLAFLPMGLGTYEYSAGGGKTVSADASFAYGVSLSVGYEVIRHLIVGLAPQVIFNVEEKVPEIASTAGSAREYDLMARVAYLLPVADRTVVYAEVLPGYSMITTDAGPNGLVVAAGLGCAIDMTDRIFVNLGVGYQIGFQTWKEGANTFDTSTRYLRVAFGGGVKL